MNFRFLYSSAKKSAFDYFPIIKKTVRQEFSKFRENLKEIRHST